MPNTSLFADILKSWYLENHRSLPWRETQDPYKIWLSEIILQQTRVQQGLPYYERFVEAYPTVFDLAKAPEEEVLRLWQGLGYYSRARNLHTAAKTIAYENEGQFPENYKGLKKLKGVGDYTAAAIASFAFQEPVAVLDGNVFRVLARVFGIDTDIASHKGKKEFSELAQSLIDQKQPDLYNQAIMEFGAMHCKPKNPDCLFCPMAELCEARKQGKVAVLPVKLKKVKVKTVHLHYIVFTFQEKLLMRERVGKGIWQGLYDFYSLESQENLSEEEVIQGLQNKLPNYSFKVRDISSEMKHILTHQRIFARFFRLEPDSLAVMEQLAKDLKLSLISTDDIEALPKPKLIVQYLKENALQN